MPEAHVVSVTGPRPVSALGVVDAHDHLFLDSPGMPGQAFTDPDKAIEEALDGQATGIGTIVEMTPIGLGRRPAGMRAVAEATGLTVIAASGYHRDAHYPAGHWVHEATVETLCDRIVTDLDAGHAPGRLERPVAAPRPGAGRRDQGRRVLPPDLPQRAAAPRGDRRRRRPQTGAAVLVHTEIGTAGHDIVDLLEAAGATTDRIALAHLDRNPDWELHAEIARAASRSSTTRSAGPSTTPTAWSST